MPSVSPSASRRVAPQRRATGMRRQPQRASARAANQRAPVALAHPPCLGRAARRPPGAAATMRGRPRRRPRWHQAAGLPPRHCSEPRALHCTPRTRRPTSARSCGAPAGASSRSSGGRSCRTGGATRRRPRPRPQPRASWSTSWSCSNCCRWSCPPRPSRSRPTRRAASASVWHPRATSATRSSTCLRARCERGAPCSLPSPGRCPVGGAACASNAPNRLARRRSTR
jgi:hypothetical protein